MRVRCSQVGLMLIFFFYSLCFDSDLFPSQPAISASKFKTILAISASVFLLTLIFPRSVNYTGLKLYTNTFLLNHSIFLIYFVVQIDSDKTVMVTFKHDDKLQENAECGFQVMDCFAEVFQYCYHHNMLKILFERNAQQI
jgi:hypothetical protein